MKQKRTSPNKSKLEVMRDKFQSGRVLSTEDFVAAGLKNVSYTLAVLRDEYKLDILSIRRGTSLIGWTLADEIL